MLIILLFRSGRRFLPILADIVRLGVAFPLWALVRNSSHRATSIHSLSNQYGLFRRSIARCVSPLRRRRRSSLAFIGLISILKSSSSSGLRRNKTISNSENLMNGRIIEGLQLLPESGQVRRLWNSTYGILLSWTNKRSIDDATV